MEALVVLSVALEEGFEDDAVVVEVNGRKVFEQDGVSTRTQIGLAVSFEVPIDQPDAVIEVRLPARGSSLRPLLLLTGTDVVWRSEGRSDGL